MAKRGPTKSKSNWLGLRGGKKRKYERERIAHRRDEGFEPIEWVDDETGDRIRLSQMGRNTQRREP